MSEPMGEPRLTAPRVRVLRDGHDPFEVQTDNRDLIRWDMTRPKHKWPKFDEAPFKWLTFLSWSAAQRTGAIEAATTYEVWESEVVDVRSMDEEDEGPEGRPTHAGQEPA